MIVNDLGVYRNFYRSLLIKGKIVVIFSILCFIGCGKLQRVPGKIENQKAQPRSLVVVAATSLQGTLESLVQAFSQQYPNVVVDIRYGSSGLLVSQIRAGAPADLLMASDVESCNTLMEAGMAKGPLVIYARGILCITGRALAQFPFPGESDSGQFWRWMQELLNSTFVQRIAIADPNLAPYGKMAMMVFDFVGLQVQDGRVFLVPHGSVARLILASSVARVRQYVADGNVDIGFVSYSLLKNRDPFIPGKGGYAEADTVVAGIPYYILPNEGYTGLPHGALPLSAKEETRWWVAFLGTVEARSILSEGGYGLP